MTPHLRQHSAVAWLILLTAVSLAGCDRRPSDAPRPSDPDYTMPKPRALPDTKAPDGLPASQPAQ